MGVSVAYGSDVSRSVHFEKLSTRSSTLRPTHPAGPVSCLRGVLPGLEHLDAVLAVVVTASGFVKHMGSDVAVERAIILVLDLAAGR